MKKNILMVIVCLAIAMSMQAQELVSKKGIPILPQKGDYAIGASATPFLDFVGNATKINSSNTFSSPASMNFIDPSKMYIYGKYFINDNTAIRAKVRMGSYSRTKIDYSEQNGETWPIMVEDKWTRSSSNLFLGAGVEKRRGYGRLQGYYGAEGLLSVMGSSKDTYTYGNDITRNYTNPNRTDFGSNLNGKGYSTTVSTKPVLGIGINAFVGVEYFFAPKISIAGEFVWGLGINQSSGVSGKSESEYEYWNNSNVITETSITSGKTSSFGIDNQSSGANVIVMFHF